MSTLTTRIRSVAEVQADEPVLAQLRALVGLSWEQPVPLLDDALTHVDSMLLGRDERGALVGFMTWRLKTAVTSAGERFNAVYAGLGAVDAAWQGQGLGKQVIYGGIEAGIEELSQRPGTSSAKPVVWTTTASPVGYLGLAKRFAKGFNPRADGSYDAAVLPMLEALKSMLGARPEHADPHPFVLRAFSSKRYVARTHDALTQVVEQKKLPLFVDHHVDERSGDRLVLLFDP